MNYSEDHLSNTICPEGVFDRTLNFLYGNTLISGIVGNCNNVCIYMLVFEEERKVLEELVKQCSENPGKEFEQEIHFADNTQGIHRLYLIKIKKMEESENFVVKLLSVSRTETRLQDVSKSLRLAREYLTFQGDFLIRYCPNSDIFRMFWVNQEENIVIYETDFEEWKAFVLKENYVEEECLGAFDRFCRAIKATEREDEFEFRSKIATKGERLVLDRIRIKRIRCGGEENMIGIWSIMDAQSKEKFRHFVEDSYLDALTGLLNKKAITEYARKAIEEGRERRIAIAIVDIDNFKSVNDTYGHMFGDKIIVAAADTIKGSIGENAVAGRVGGDEFLVVFQDYADETDIRNRLRCMKMNFSQIYKDEMKDVAISCSVGVSRYPRDAGKYDELFKIADKCLYIAKQKGKNRYILYEPEKHGQFMDNDGSNDMVDIKEAFFSEKDMLQIHNMLSDIIIEGETAIAPLLQKAAETMNLDRISVVWDKQVVACFANEYAKDKPQLDLAILENEQYVEQFHDNFFSANNVSRMEFKIPKAYEYMRQSGIFTIMQYLLRDKDGKIKGVLTAEGCQKVFSIPAITNETITNIGRVLNAVLLRELKN